MFFVWKEAFPSEVCLTTILTFEAVGHEKEQSKATQLEKKSCDK